MGNAVSRVYGTIVKRPLQRFNVEHRAEKLITKFEDPKAAPQRAPMYEADVKVREEIIRTEDGVHKVGPELLDRLKQVYVDSQDTNPRAAENPDRPLPRDVAQHYQDFVPAQMRVERQGRERSIPRGRVTLNQTLDILNKYRTTEGEFGAEQISGEYKINKNVADNVVRYYELFNMMETNTRENEYDPPDPLTAGKDWVDIRSLEGEKIIESAEHMAEAKEKIKKRIESGQNKKKLLGDSS